MSSLSRVPLCARSVNGRNSSYKGWAYPVPWSTYTTLLSTATSGSPSGQSVSSAVATYQSIGLTPLVVQWLTCSYFSFSTTDQTTSAYWIERWNLYKHKYALAVWAYKNGVRFLEDWNEPDLNPTTSTSCVTVANWPEFVITMGTAVGNAFTDMNSDVAQGYRSCPSAFGSCPVTVQRVMSAFAADPWSGTPALGNPSLWNNNVTFPYYLGVQNASWDNFDAFSVHSYGKTGQQLYQYGKELNSGVPSSMPVHITEHQAHTNSAWNSIATTGDTYLEASRLASQIIWTTSIAVNTWIFKFSMLTSTNGGVTKSGLHWGDITTSPYPIGDTTLSAEAARLVISSMAGNLTLENVSRTSGYSLPSYFSSFNAYVSFRVVNDGLRRRLVIVNDGNNNTSPTIGSYSFQAVVSVSGWGITAGTYITMQEASVNSFGEVTYFQKVPANLSVTLPVPGWSTVVADFPISAQTVSKFIGLKTQRQRAEPRIACLTLTFLRTIATGSHSLPDGRLDHLRGFLQQEHQLRDGHHALRRDLHYFGPHHHQRRSPQVHHPIPDQGHHERHLGADRGLGPERLLDHAHHRQRPRPDVEREERDLVQRALRHQLVAVHYHGHHLHRQEPHQPGRQQVCGGSCQRGLHGQRRGRPPHRRDQVRDRLRWQDRHLHHRSPDAQQPVHRQLGG